MTVTPFGSRSTAPRRGRRLEPGGALDDGVEIDAHLERHRGGAHHVHQVAAAEQRHLQVAAAGRRDQHGARSVEAEVLDVGGANVARRRWCRT